MYRFQTATRLAAQVRYYVARWAEHSLVFGLLSEVFPLGRAPLASYLHLASWAHTEIIEMKLGHMQRGLIRFSLWRGCVLKRWKERPTWGGYSVSVPRALFTRVWVFRVKRWYRWAKISRHGAPSDEFRACVCNLCDRWGLILLSKLAEDWFQSGCFVVGFCKVVVWCRLTTRCWGTRGLPLLERSSAWGTASSTGTPRGIQKEFGPIQSAPSIIFALVRLPFSRFWT